MKALSIWLRRGLGWRMAIGLTSFLITSLLLQRGWGVEYDWGSRLTTAPLLMFTPCVAAVTAFDVSRRLRPTITRLSLGSVRTPLAYAAPAVAVWIWATAAYLLTWVFIGVWVAATRGAHPTDWWVFAEVPAALCAASFIGAGIGMKASSRWAAPLAAIAVLGLGVLAAPWGRGPFEGVTTYGTLTGLERSPDRAAAAVVGTLVTTLACVTAVVAGRRGKWSGRSVRFMSAIVVVSCAVLPAAWPWQDDVFRPTRESYACTGRAPSVCAPASRVALMIPVQESLARAYSTLRGTPFVAPQKFRVTRLDHYSDLGGAAPLDYDPANVVAGTFVVPAVARALARPHQCEGLFDPEDSSVILDAQDRVIPWLESALRGEVPAFPVPEDVTTAWDVIEQCRIFEGDLH